MGKNLNSHVFGMGDYLVYNQEASLLHFLGEMDREPKFDPMGKNLNSHVFGMGDYLVYNQEASLLHFLGEMDREPKFDPTPT